MVSRRAVCLTWCVSTLPDTLEVGGVTFSRVDSPEGLACWTAQNDNGFVSLVIEPPAVPSAEVIDVAVSVITDFPRLTDEAITFLREQLRSPEYGLLPDELALLDGQAAPFDSPEAVIWADGTWMLRFAESGLRMAEEFGIGVNFVGSVPQSVDSFSDAESVEAGE